MERIKVLIVDDSRISCAMLSDILSKTNFLVVGTAANAAEAVEKYKELHPAVVTMDMNLPDADGIECSRRIREIDSAAKIVMISAMRDASLMAQGRAAGISSFLQKPVNPNELIDTLSVLCHGKAGTIMMLRESYVKTFVKVLQKTLFSLIGEQSEVTIDLDEENYLDVSGVAVIVGLTGTPSGRAIVYMEHPVMENFACKMLGKKDASELEPDEAGDAAEEAANIIIGHGVSAVNDMFRDKEMRITPPGTICGETIHVANFKMTAFRVIAKTGIGDICMNIGFTEEA